MQELLKDPSTLPFLKKNKVCLKVLKKDIDRRVTKIRSMLGGQKPETFKLNKTVNQACQTDEAGNKVHSLV